MLTEMKKWL